MKWIFCLSAILSLFLSPIWAEEPKSDFQWEVDQFGDVRILRYQVPAFEKLTLQQKLLVYYLTQAGLCGRDIMYDQNCLVNLTVRRTIERVVEHYQGDRQSEGFQKFMEYAKKVWMANGIHHHYSNDKFLPEFSYETFVDFVKHSPDAKFPTRENETLDAFLARIKPILFDPAYLPKKVSQTAGIDCVATSAVNFYEGVTSEEVDAFYAKLQNPDDKTPPSHGLNAKLVKVDGKVVERPWKVGGMYGEALSQVVYWLEKAATVAESDKQKEVILSLISYLRSGDLREFDRHCILWVDCKDTTVDFILGFIEVYNDPKGLRGSFECVVEVVDPEMTAKIGVLGQHTQWFEDNSPILSQHKKEKVTGILWRAINVVCACGDSSPASPIGINLPNAEWIREQHGSKSINLANIVFSYNQLKGSGIAKEFYYSEEHATRLSQYSDLVGDLTTALHEVIGHASGKLEPGVSDPQAVLGHYASTLEEARADLLALYYIYDSKLVEWGLMPSLDAGKAEYDSYIQNGLMLQLRRIKEGSNIEEAHMRNRQLIAKWAYEKGLPENVVEKKVREGKTYFVINDYQRLRVLFGELLCEIQRIKSQGDKAAGIALVENYGVKVDPELHKEVLARFKSLNSGPPYAGFINPRLKPVLNGNDEIVDVIIEYPDNFVAQMLEYGKLYSFLPNDN